jgi:hypothetical protein
VSSWNVAIFLTDGRVTTIPIGNRNARASNNDGDVKLQAIVVLLRLHAGLVKYNLMTIRAQATRYHAVVCSTRCDKTTDDLPVSAVVNLPQQ